MSLPKRRFVLQQGFVDEGDTVVVQQAFCQNRFLGLQKSQKLEAVHSGLSQTVILSMQAVDHQRGRDPNDGGAVAELDQPRHITIFACVGLKPRLVDDLFFVNITWERCNP